MPAVHLTKSDERSARTKKILKIAIMEKATDQKTLAKKVNMTYGTLHKRINHPGTCSFEEMWKILDALEVPVDERAKMLM